MTSPLPIIDGRYEARAELGAGAFGKVYRCYDERFDREVAVKLLVRGGLDAAGLRRFQEEATAASRVRDRHVVQLLDAGVAGDSEPYLVFELVEGPSLEARGQGQPRPTPAEVLGWVRQMARGLVAVHGAGVLHRDLKPANVLLDRGVARLCDFGLARRLDRETLLTKTGALVGTVRFLAPELFRGVEASERSDLWSLGATAYEVAYGVEWHRPLELQRVMEQGRHGDGEPAPERFGLGGPLDGALRRLLHADPARRPASARALLEDLEEAEEPGGVARRSGSRPGAPGPVGLPDAGPVGPPGAGRAGPTAGRAWRRGAAALAAAGLLGGLALAWRRSARPPPTGPAAPRGEPAALAEARGEVQRWLAVGTDAEAGEAHLQTLVATLRTARGRSRDRGLEALADLVTRLAPAESSREEPPPVPGPDEDWPVELQLARRTPPDDPSEWLGAVAEELLRGPPGAAREGMESLRSWVTRPPAGEVRWTGVLGRIAGGLATRLRVEAPAWREVAGAATSLAAAAVARTQEPDAVGRVLDELLRLLLVHGGPEEDLVHRLERELEASPGGAEAPGPARALSAWRRGLRARRILDEPPSEAEALGRALEALRLDDLPLDFQARNAREQVELALPKYLDPAAALRFRRVLVAALFGPPPSPGEGRRASQAVWVVTGAWSRLNASAQWVGIRDLGQGEAAAMTRRWAYAWSDYRDVVQDVQAAVSASPERSWTRSQQTIRLTIAMIHPPPDLGRLVRDIVADLPEEWSEPGNHMVAILGIALGERGVRAVLGPEAVAEAAVSVGGFGRSLPPGGTPQDRHHHRVGAMKTVVQAMQNFSQEVPEGLEEEFRRQLELLASSLPLESEQVLDTIQEVEGLFGGNDLDEVIGGERPVEARILRSLEELRAAASRPLAGG